jgi:hypothetical protein
MFFEMALCLGDGQDGELGYKGRLGGRLGISHTFVFSSLHTFATQTWGSRVISAYQRQKTCSYTFLRQHFLS